MFIFLLFVCASCSTPRVEQLSDRLEKFHYSLRWSSLPSASAAFDNSKRKELIGQYATKMERWRVIDFAVLDMSMDEKKLKSSVIVQYTMHNLVSESIHKKQELENWEYDKDKGDWFLFSSQEIGK